MGFGLGWGWRLGLGLYHTRLIGFLFFRPLSRVESRGAGFGHLQVAIWRGHFFTFELFFDILALRLGWNEMEGMDMHQKKRVREGQWRWGNVCCCGGRMGGDLFRLFLLLFLFSSFRLLCILFGIFQSIYGYPPPPDE